MQLTSILTTLVVLAAEVQAAAVTTTHHTTTTSSKKSSSSVTKHSTSSAAKPSASSAIKASTSNVAKPATSSSSKQATSTASKKSTTSASGQHTPTTTTRTQTGPITISNTASAVSSVLKAMGSLKPSTTTTTIQVTPSKASSGSIKASQTTLNTKPTAVIPKSGTTSTTTTSKKGTSSITATTKKASTITVTTSAKKGTTTTHTSSTKAGTTKSSTTGKSVAGDVSIERVVVNPTQTKKLGARDACATEPASSFTYVPAVAGAAGFLLDSTLYTTALAATAPSGYSWIYAGFYAELNAPGYITETQISTYDQNYCASFCNNITTCAGFSIFFERAPTLTPGTGCLDPAAMVIARCTFYSQASSIDPSYALNVGEWRSNFQVVNAGANGYIKSSNPGFIGTASVTGKKYTTTTTTTTKTTTTTTTTVNPTSTPFYMQVQSSSDSTVNSKYLTASKSTSGDNIVLTSLVTNATKFVINSNTGLIYEYNNNKGYFANLNPSSANQIVQFQSATPSTYTSVSCMYGSWIACTMASTGAGLGAVTCNSDGNVYWTTNYPTNCTWFALVPISAPA